jgi:DNA-binding response OmpR family regulator
VARNEWNRARTSDEKLATKLLAPVRQLEDWMQRPIVLVVAHSRGFADTLLPVLNPNGYQVVVADSFITGKQQLMRHPQLLITELRLGEYNGLHLALRAQSEGVPAIVIGDADPVLQRDAVGFGATYLTVDEPIADRVEAVLRHTPRIAPPIPAANITWGVYSGHSREAEIPSVFDSMLGTRLTNSYH